MTALAPPVRLPEFAAESKRVIAPNAGTHVRIARKATSVHTFSLKETTMRDEYEAFDEGVEHFASELWIILLVILLCGLVIFILW